MQPHNEFRIHPHVVQIGCYWGGGGHTELYLLQGDTLAIVDTGVNDTPEAYIAPALESCGLTLGDVDLILNTHGHFDHTGGNGPVAKASGAEVWVHTDDARIAEDIDFQFDTYFAQNCTLAGHLDRLDESRANYHRQSELAMVSRRLADGDLIDLGKGIKLRVIHTPGHTAGSVCYYWEEAGMALLGDSVMGLGSRPGGFPLIYYPDAYLRSIDRLLETEISTLGLGHHYRTTTLPRDSVHFSSESVQGYLQASREVALLIGDAFERAAGQHPGAGFLEVAQAATDLVAENLPVEKDADGLPVAGPTAAFYGFWKLLGR